MKTRAQGQTETPVFTCTYCKREIDYDWYGIQREEKIRFMWCPYDYHKAYEEGAFDNIENGEDPDPKPDPEPEPPERPDW